MVPAPVRYIVCFILAFWAAAAGLRAQGGLTFEQWKPKLDPYFAEELIGDMEGQLPRGTSYKIWGWDVGDFSGDGYNDCALSVRISGDRRKVMRIFFFVDIDGYLTGVGSTEVPYLELPIEAGISIRDNACFITRKRRQYFWDVQGYRFDNGSLINLDEFSTSRQASLTHESYRNFQTLYGYEKYLNTRSGKTEHMVEYLSIPSYARGRYVYKGYAAEVTSNSIRFVPAGAYYWDGEDDASFTVRSAYNDEFLYFIVNVRDESVVSENEFHDAWDEVEVWLDAVGKPDRYLQTDSKKDFRAVADTGIFSFRINPGNFSDRRPDVSVSATDEMTELQNLALQDIRVVSNQNERGYTVKLRLPFLLLGYAAAPVDEDAITEFGCTVVVRDIDNGFRPEEQSLIATSRFESLNPASYGSLLILPNSMGYGHAENIYTDAFAERLKELGF